MVLQLLYFSNPDAQHVNLKTRFIWLFQLISTANGSDSNTQFKHFIIYKFTLMHFVGA